MRRSAILLVLGLPAWGPLGAQEFAKPVARTRFATGRFAGSVQGRHTDTLSNGDIVTEQIDCVIRMRFDPDGTVAYDAGNYFYEKYYYKKTTTGGYLVGHTRIVAGSSSGRRNTRARVWVTQYGDVWNARWTPKVDQPSDVLQESWLTDGLGRTWGQSTPLATHPTAYCEPQVLWRGKDGKGPGLRPQGSYAGPDAFRPWAKVQADWSFQF